MLVFRRYFSKAICAAVSNTDIAREFMSVMHLLKPPAALFGPVIAVPVARLAIGDAVAALLRAREPSPTAST